MNDQLFLLRPGFFNGGLGPLYCGDSVAIEGFLSFFPDVRGLIDVHYIDFKRPRESLVALLGEQQQSVPVLVVGQDHEIKDGGVVPQSQGGHRFIADERLIRRYLSTQYNLPIAG